MQLYEYVCVLMYICGSFILQLRLLRLQEGRMSDGCVPRGVELLHVQSDRVDMDVGVFVHV